jgi:RecJ-like exonuclease
MSTDVALTFYTDRREVTLTFPGKFKVCPRCDGKGTHVNPSIDGNGISQEEFDRDPDFEEAYFGGMYDVPCYRCKGLRVVAVVDENRLTPKQKARIARYRVQQEATARYNRECEMERRMGA